MLLGLNFGAWYADRLHSAPVFLLTVGTGCLDASRNGVNWSHEDSMFACIFTRDVD